MSDKEHAYSNGEVSIVWRPGLCIHSAKCWHGLPEVFKPGTRPWITPQGISTQRIIGQVAQCPSGALSIRNDAGTERATLGGTIAVEVTHKGPLLVKGTVDIRHTDGRLERKDTQCALCRCGHSANKPYCDGAHRRTGFEG
ncbi:MAG: (4Fe-4S)-binding protein [Flavobacteriales bacterium]|nr:(4Fe-4S)-binding protein [Flavobacteriales bacterium]MBK7268894.1 (4Fe-4S)-binding protein [Flavobacteriales bacterium]MBK7752202.1 (4Fe-4S)-binding protein [Flavobacteriales bacterium]MBK9074314.1 (4Fe-4S)-binding protein [Flavobacteriales bacterium]